MSQPFAFTETLGPYLHDRPEPAFLSVEERRAQIERVQEFCWKTGILENGKNTDENGFEYVVVPGGHYNVNTYAVSPDVGERNAESEPVSKSERTGTQEVFIGSFLMFKYPVSNGQFRSFYEKNEQYGPKQRRLESKNNYYLVGFPGEDKSDEAEEWRRPVVRVDLDAAAHFAEHYSLLLPSEIHYECAVRIFWDDADFANPNSAHEYPWPGPSAEEFARYRKPNEDRITPIWKNGNRDEEVGKLKTWEDEIGSIWKAHVPEGLVDGVLEWTQDPWREQWPAVPPGGWFETPPNWLARLQPDINYAVRGGSYLEPKTQVGLSNRRSSNGRWVNEDRGFRCVKPLIAPVRPATRQP